MSPEPKSHGVHEARGPAALPEAPVSPLALVIVAWLVPGAGHAWLGRPGKAAVFFVVLIAMFAIGLGCGGRLFPLQGGDLLVLLAALAEWALGAPHLLASLAGAGRGEVVAAAYEYGNTFLIAAGLLNALVILDAVDIATGRRA